MSVYKIGWTLVDGIDGKIRGSDRMWFDKEPDKWNVLWRLDRVIEAVSSEIGETIARNFYRKFTESTAPVDIKVRYIREDRFRRGDIVLVGKGHTVRTRKGLTKFPPTKLTINQVRGNIVIGRTFGIGNSVAEYFLRDLVLLKAREEK